MGIPLIQNGSYPWAPSVEGLLNFWTPGQGDGIQTFGDAAARLNAVADDMGLPRLEGETTPETRAKINALISRAIPSDASLYLDFLFGRYFASSLSFSRFSGGSYYDANGVMQYAANNQIRLDHNPLTGAPRGVLIEGPATNLATQSETFTAGTGIPNGNISKSQPAPDGSNNASLVIENDQNSEHFVNDVSVPVTEGQTYVWSWFVEAGPGERNAYLRCAGAISVTAIFNPRTGVWVGSGGGAGFVSRGFEQLRNGRYRVWIVATAHATGTGIFRIQLTSGTSAVYQGDGTSGLIVWGRQVETSLPFPTSYIRTSGQQTTRGADHLIAHLPTPTGREYTFAVAYRMKGPAASIAGNRSAFWAWSTLASGNETDLVNTGGGSNGQWRSSTDGTNQGTIVVGAQNMDTTERAAFLLSPNRYAWSRNGGSVSQRLSGTPPLLTSVRIGSAAGTWHLNGWVEKLTFIDHAVSDARLRELAA